MIDDHPDARPQSGFNAASVVWHAPGRGRHPALHADLPGPRSRAPSDRCAARGSTTSRGRPSGTRCTATPAGRRRRCRRCANQGNGQLVYNADEFRWGNIYYHRSTDRFAPHNVYTTRQGAAEAGQADRGEGRAVQGRVAVRARRTRRPIGRRAAGSRWPTRWNNDHLPLRPQDEHVHADRSAGRSSRSTAATASRWRRRTSS